MRILIKNLPPKKNVLLAEINFYNSTSSKMPFCSHFETQEINLTSPKTSFVLNNSNITDFVVFYKTGKNSTELQKNTWRIYEGIRKEKFEITTLDTIIKFLVVYVNKPGSKAQLIKN